MKKVVSMTLDENLIAVVKSYADERHLSFSAAVSYIVSCHFLKKGGDLKNGEKITAGKTSI